jgi:putative hydrolase of the HAD superfamily
VRAGVKAVLLDALGTLVELQPPAPRLQRLLAEAGFEVSEEQAAAGFMAEIAYYLDHHLEGSDPERLERLRDRCAEEMRRALDLPDLNHATARRAMLEALEFRP